MTETFDALPGLSPIQHLGEMQHCGWSVWITAIADNPHRTVDAWRADPVYQSHRTDMPDATRGRIKAWVEGLPVRTAAEMAALDHATSKRVAA